MERSRGGLDKIGGIEIEVDKIGSEVASSAQLRDDGGVSVVIQVGSWVGSGCGNVCETMS